METRDYDFGNRLARLRQARGYSQFQLGTLVGVTDKAVSKWENGTAKPRVAVIMKLAAVLGVDVEEILMEAKEERQKDAEALATKKRELWTIAESRMKEVYGNVPELTVWNRFLMEKNALGNSDIIVLFETLQLLGTYANSHYGIFTPRALASCSFVAWLLRATKINPLPAHYYCPNCHRIIFCEEYKSGWDLPESTCKVCGTELQRDGHDLPFEICACGTNNALVSLDCNISEELIDEGWEIILKHLSPYYSFMRQVSNDKGFKSGRIYLFPPRGKKVEGIDSIPIMDEETWLHYLGNIPSLYLFPYRGRKERVSDSPYNLIQPKLMTSAFRTYVAKEREAYEMLVRETGGKHEIAFDISQFPDESYEIKSFSQFVDTLCAMSGTYIGGGPKKLGEELGVDDYLKLPFSREDIWHLVCRSSGFGNQATGIASEIVYKTRKGLYRRSFSEEDLKLFEQLNLPPWFAAFVQKIQYLFPRSHFVSYAYQLLQMQKI